MNHKHLHNGWFQCSNNCYRQVQHTLRCVEEHGFTRLQLLPRQTVTFNLWPPIFKTYPSTGRTATIASAKPLGCRLGNHGTGVRFLEVVYCFLNFRVSRSSLGPTQPPNERVLLAPIPKLFCQGVKLTAHPQSSGEVRNKWSYIPFSHIPLWRVHLDLSPG
jgi:hypothetical protein